MKLLLLFVAACFMLHGNSQTPFEGKIVYTVTVPEKDGDGELTIFFGKPGIRLQFTETKKPEKLQEVILINLDSGKVFTLKPSEKQYTVAALKQRSERVLPGPTDIAGFATMPTTLEASSMTGVISSMFTEPILYPANDLYYPIPELYIGNPELMMIHKGRIILGAEIFVPEYSEGQWNLNRTIDTAKERKSLFKIMAHQVNKQQVDLSLFHIPADFTKREQYDFGSDSTTIAGVDGDTTYPLTGIDTSFLERQKLSPSKSKKSPSKKKRSTKQNATLRKND